MKYLNTNIDDLKKKWYVKTISDFFNYCAHDNDVWIQRVIDDFSYFYKEYFLFQTISQYINDVEPLRILFISNEFERLEERQLKKAKKFIFYAISIDEYWNNIVIPELFDLDDKWKIVIAKLKEAKESKLKIN